MSIPLPLNTFLQQLPPKQWYGILAQFESDIATTESRTKVVETLLRHPVAGKFREEMGRWIVDQLVPVEELVPEKYEEWRPPVRDAMLFVISNLSVPRLAPKLVEQYELPSDTPATERLLRFISKVPGLQKLGQILARNRHLKPALRRALSKLENGIRDVSAEDVCAAVRRELGQKKLKNFEVRIRPAILSEASVSAVVRFSWLNPKTSRRERGVFKVIKSYIPECFAEDMRILQELADFFGKHRDYGFSPHLIPDTFRKVRRHLQHEVDFPGEQASLLEAREAYRSVRGLRIPEVITPLCTSKITALSEEHGMKITSAARHLGPGERRGMAEQLITAVVGFPLFSAKPDAIFHADPHAGNLLYNLHTHELTLLDWALVERLSREQRRHLMLLFVAVALRNPASATGEIEALSQHGSAHSMREARLMRETVTTFVEELPLARMPRAIDAMNLLERAALSGVRFPSSLVMFSKVLFTLDGIVDEIQGSDESLDLAIIRQAIRGWVKSPQKLWTPLKPADWIAMEFSALLYCGRLGVRWQQALARRLLKRRSVPAIPVNN
jgi:ubiquinone biosynthesis protein